MQVSDKTRSPLSEHSKTCVEWQKLTQHFSPQTKDFFIHIINYKELKMDRFLVLPSSIYFFSLTVSFFMAGKAKEI